MVQSRLTLDVIGPTAMGRDFKSLTTEENAIAQSFLEILHPSRDRLAFLGLYFVLPPWIMSRLPWSINAMLNRNQKFLRGLCHNIIDEKKFELLKQQGGKDYDILSTIMQTKEFSDSELVDQMLTFLAAGVSWNPYLIHTMYTDRHPLARNNCKCIDLVLLAARKQSQHPDQAAQ